MEENASSSLAVLAEGRYQLTLEESWDHERPEVRERDRQWYERIPCKDGAWIGLFSDGDCEVTRHYAPNLIGGIILQLYIPSHKRAGRVWARLKDCHHQCHADLGLDSEGVIYFLAEVINQVAKAAGAKRKRRLSPEAGAKLAKQGIAALELYRNRNVGSENPTQI